MTTPRRSTTGPKSRSNGRAQPAPQDDDTPCAHPDEPGFGMVHGPALKQHHLPSTALAVYVWLCCEAYADTATISLNKLADLTQTSRATVCRALGTLRQAGLVTSETHDDATGSHLATRYHLPLLTPHFSHHTERRTNGRPWDRSTPPLSAGETSPPLSAGETSPPLSAGETSPPLSAAETSLVSPQDPPCPLVKQALSAGETTIKEPDYSKTNTRLEPDCASGAPPLPSSAHLWPAVRTELAAIMTPHNFHSHIAAIHALPQEDGSLTLLAPNSFERDWLEHKLGRRLTDTFLYVARRAGVPDPQPPPLHFACA